MIAILVGLQWMMLKGRVRRSLRLLRQPRYLVGSIIGFGWMLLWVGRPLFNARFNVNPGSATVHSAAFVPVAHGIAALFVTVGMPLPWLWPWGRLGLPFRESELTMLLQAPLSRRQVIQYGLLKSEVGVIFSALVLSLFTARGGPVARLSAFLGTWLLFEFWHVNGRWRAMFNLRQTEIPVGRARTLRVGLSFGLLVFYAMLASALAPFLKAVGAAVIGASRDTVVASLAGLAWPPFLTALVAPAWWLTAPMFAAGPATFLTAVVPTALMILAQREAVLRSKACFEESALEHAKSRESRQSETTRVAKTSARARLRRPFALEPLGLPEIAVIWKNATRVSRIPWTRVAAGAAILVAALALLPALLRLPDVTYTVTATAGLVMMCFFPLFGGMAWNNDLRTEITHIELVKTWPVEANRFVLAEVLSPVLFSFAGATFAAATVLASLLGSRLRQALTGEPTKVLLLPRTGELLGVDNAVAAVLLLVSFLIVSAAASVFSSSLQNLAVLLLPAWMVHTADRSRGIAAIGSRTLFSFAFGLSFALALIPSALLVGAAVLAQSALSIPWSAWEFPFWALLAAAPLFVEAILIVRGASPLWDRLDPSQEILELGR